MKWALAAAALVVAADAAVLIPAARERATPATRVTVAVCASHLIGGGSSGAPPALQLRIAPESLPGAPGLDSAGLRALGFTARMAAAMGKARDSTFRWPRPRPAWVRLRQQRDSLARFAIVQVAPRRALLAPDSTSIVIRARVGASVLFSEVPRGPSGGGIRAPGRLYPTVEEVIPFQLHLDRRQSTALARALSGTSGCAVTQSAVIAVGGRGGIWVESVR
jgi:hypothetical protein